MDINLLLALGLCLLISGFFSASETALVSLPHAKIHQMLEEKRKMSSALHFWLKKPNYVLTTILVCNNLFNTLGAVLATVFAQKVFGSYAIGIATGMTTLALLLVGEITPKIFAKNNAERIAALCMSILIPMYFITFPVIHILNTCASLLVKLSGSDPSAKQPVATQEDIDFLIRLGHKEGVLRGKEGKILDNVVQFRATLVQDAMVPRTQVQCLDKEASLPVVIRIIQQYGHSRSPVYSNDLNHIVGVFYSKDLIRVLANSKASFHLADHLRPALFVPEKMKMGALLREFQQGKAHLAIVVNKAGATVGIITLEDVLQEIVGHIHDDYDKNKLVK